MNDHEELRARVERLQSDLEANAAKVDEMLSAEKALLDDAPKEDVSDVFAPTRIDGRRPRFVVVGGRWLVDSDEKYPRAIDLNNVHSIIPKKDCIRFAYIRSENYHYYTLSCGNIDEARRLFGEVMWAIYESVAPTYVPPALSPDKNVDPPKYEKLNEGG